MRSCFIVFCVWAFSPFTIYSQQPGNKSDLDMNNPKYFTTVEEIAGEQKKVNKILSYEDYFNDDTAKPVDIVNPEVDLDSKIKITFDRDLIKDSTVEAEIMIRGYVDSEEGTRPIEIPNYSIVGEKAREMPAKIHSVDRFFDLFSQLQTDFNGIWSAINQHLYETDLAYEDENKTSKILDTVENEEGRIDVTGIDDGPRMSPNYAKLLNSTLVKKIKDILLNKSRSMEFTLKELIKEENEYQLNIVADLIDWSPDYLKSEANEVIEKWLPHLRTVEVTDNNKDSVFYESYKIIEVVFWIADINIDDDAKDKLRNRFVRNLKDTEFHIASTGAKSGDVITLVLSNGKMGSEDYREHRIKLLVRDFGFKLKTSDTLLMIKRRGVSSTSDEALINSLQGDTEDRAEVPTDYNFVPTAGATFGGTYYARRTKWLGIPAFFKPGIGLNVSFPRFGSKIASYSADVIDDTTTERSITIDESSNTVDLGLGLAITLFDNTIVFTYGRNLTAEEKQTYWGLGFNFLKVAGVVKSGLTD